MPTIWCKNGDKFKSCVNFETPYISENALQIKIIENCEDINNERLMRKIENCEDINNEKLMGKILQKKKYKEYNEG